MIEKEFLKQSILTTMLEENYMIMDSKFNPLFFRITKEPFLSGLHKSMYDFTLILDKVITGIK